MHEEMRPKTACIALISILAILIICPCAYCQMRWQNFVDSKGKFSIMMPGNPTKTFGPYEVPGLPPSAMITFKTKDKNSVYLVIYVDYPSEFLKGLNLEEFYDNAREGGLSNVNGILRGEQRIRLNKYIGREILATTSLEKPNDTVIKNRIFLIKNRFYILSITSLRGQASVIDHNKFFNSFHFT